MGERIDPDYNPTEREVENFAFQSVPTNSAELPAFDRQIRDLYNAPSIAESVVSDAPDKAQQVCATLAKPAFDQQDREFLYGVIESLYETYP